MLQNSKLFDIRNLDIDNVDEKDCVVVHRQRCADCLQCPGLCAEDCIAIVKTFICDVLRWDVENEKVLVLVFV